jgi:hypothetical protein
MLNENDILDGRDIACILANAGKNLALILCEAISKKKGIQSLPTSYRG